MTRRRDDRDRLNPEKTGRQLDRIERLIDEVREAWFIAADAGVRPFVKADNARGKPLFEEHDQTASVALSGAHAAIRRGARRSAYRIETAMESLEDAAVILADCLLATDQDEWVRVTDKRDAALGR